ncbi:zf-HC2 domain-containing protein [Spongiactinospora sp. 9N601]|uniref:zf-HC2 domain-containing protein n=1 Tax=Spongiactinospora sp. 9N601 TaxID=3375149 RepID=UPI0037BDFF90
MTTQWHIPQGLLDDYLADQLDQSLAASVDAHLAECSHCRSLVPANEAWLDDIWEQVAEVIVSPDRTLFERVVIRCGLPDHQARLVAATPGLAWIWLLGVLLSLGFAFGAAAVWSSEILPFLVLAPLFPLSGIALAYGYSVDPAHEITAATPSAGLRLLLLRAPVTLIPAIVLTSVLAPFLGQPPGISAAWLLPALMLTLAVLALGTRSSLQVAAAVVGGVWLATVALVVISSGEWLPLFQPVAQSLYAVAAFAFAMFVYVKRDIYSYREST